MAAIVKFTDLKPGQHFFVATEGMRGHFACEMWINNEDKEGFTFPEPWQSDDATFATREEAVTQAMFLATLNDLPYVV